MSYYYKTEGSITKLTVSRVHKVRITEDSIKRKESPISAGSPFLGSSNNTFDVS